MADQHLEKPPQPRRVLRPWVLALALGLFLAVIWMSALKLASDLENDAIADASRRSTVVASFYRDHVSNAFDYADGYIRSVRQVYLQRQSLADVRRYLTEIPISAEFVSHITLMGPDGRPRLLMSAQGERTPNRTRHARDRAYFKFQHNTPGDKIYISGALKGRNTGIVTLRLVRRVSGPNGEFLGVIFAAIKESQLLKFHEATRIGPKSVISLIGLDKRIRYRRSHLGLTGIGKSTAKSQSWKLLEKGPTGQFRQRSVVDGTTRIWSFNRFNRYPLIAMVGTAVSDVQASVANSKRDIYGNYGLFSLIGIIGFLIGLREIVVSQRRARDAEERRAAEQQAVEKSAILDATFQNMAQGIAVFDADHNLKTFNRQYGEILELPPDFLRPGLNRADIFRCRLEHGQFEGATPTT